MNYNSKKTLTENLDYVENKILIFEQDVKFDRKYGDPSYLEKQIEDYEADKAAQYPNFCPISQLAIEPPENKLGASGVEALPPNHCYYTTPVGGFFIPYEFAGTTTNFELIDFDWVDKMVSSIIKRRFTEEKIIEKELPLNSASTKDKPYSEYIEKIKTSLEQSLLKYIGQICGFTIGGENYKLYMRSNWLLNDITTAYATPVGYSTYPCKVDEIPCQTQNGKWYENPQEVDRRSEFAKFIDEWSMTIQISAAVATIVLTMIFPAAGMAIFIGGAAIEVGFGIADGVRAMEKGDDIGAILSFVFAFIPIAFLRAGGKSAIGKFFSRGINLEASQALSKKLLTSGLKKSSTWIDYFKFWKTLDKEERIILEQILEQDEITRETFFKNLVKEGAEALTDTSFMKKSLAEFFDKFKKYYENGVITSYEAIPWMRKLWVREASMYGTAMVLQMVGDFVGAVFDQNTITEVEWIGKYLPNSDILINITANPADANQAISVLQAQPIYQEVKQVINETPDSLLQPDSTMIKNMNNLLNFAYADSIRMVSQTDTIIRPSVKFEKIDISEVELNQKKSEGWVLMTSVLPWDFPEFTANNTKVFNGNAYIYMPNYKKTESIEVTSNTNKNTKDTTNVNPESPKNINKK